MQRLVLGPLGLANTVLHRAGGPETPLRDGHTASRPTAGRPWPSRPRFCRATPTRPAGSGRPRATCCVTPVCTSACCRPEGLIITASRNGDAGAGGARCPAWSCRWPQLVSSRTSTGCGVISHDGDTWASTRCSSRCRNVGSPSSRCSTASPARRPAWLRSRRHWPASQARAAVRAGGPAAGTVGPGDPLDFRLGSAVNCVPTRGLPRRSRTDRDVPVSASACSAVSS